MARQFVLHGEDVNQVPVEPLSPQVPAGRRVDELRRHPDPNAGFAYASAATGVADFASAIVGAVSRVVGINIASEPVAAALIVRIERSRNLIRSM